MKKSKKHKFTPAEKYAVYRVLGPNCIWCREPVEYRDSELDHVLPESLDSQEVEGLKKHYKLPTAFAINSFFNWAPVHPRCNKSKLASTFEGAPFIGGILHKINKRVAEMEKLHQEAKSALNSKLTLLQLENAIEKKELTRNEVERLFEQKIKAVKVKPSVIYDRLNCSTSMVIYKSHYGRKSPKQFYDISFEQFDTTEKYLTELNCIIKSEAISELITARENYYGYLEEYDPQDSFTDIDSSREYSMHFSLATKNLLVTLPQLVFMIQARLMDNLQLQDITITLMSSDLSIYQVIYYAMKSSSKN